MIVEFFDVEATLVLALDAVPALFQLIVLPPDVVTVMPPVLATINVNLAPAAPGAGNAKVKATVEEAIHVAQSLFVSVIVPPVPTTLPMPTTWEAGIR